MQPIISIYLRVALLFVVTNGTGIVVLDSLSQCAFLAQVACLERVRSHLNEDRCWRQNWEGMQPEEMITK